MILLALETAGPVCGVCCVQSGRLPIVKIWRHDRTLASDLAPRIRSCLDMADLRLNDLDSIACGAGPGSFTGIRVGVTAAKTLAAVLGLRLVLPSTLAALAASRPHGDLQLSLLPASGGQLAAAFYRAGSWKPEEALPEGTWSPGEIRNACAGMGREFASCAPQWAEVLALNPPVEPAPTRVHQSALVAAVARLGEAMLDAGLETPVHTAAPRYLQASTPELRLVDQADS